MFEQHLFEPGELGELLLGDLWSVPPVVVD